MVMQEDLKETKVQEDNTIRPSGRKEQYQMQTETYVYKKEVDWSLFNYGLAIPLEYQVVFKQITNRFLERQILSGEAE